MLRDRATAGSAGRYCRKQPSNGHHHADRESLAAASTQPETCYPAGKGSGQNGLARPDQWHPIGCHHLQDEYLDKSQKRPPTHKISPGSELKRRPRCSQFHVERCKNYLSEWIEG